MDKQELPEVLAYYEARDTANTAYSADLDKAREIEDYDRKVTARRTARQALDDAFTAAAEDLKKSNHPVVRWIANSDVLDEYPNQAEVVLRELRPDTTVRDLDALAKDRNWCYVWGEYRSQIIAAGVIAPADYQIQMRVNGGPWQPFWEHETQTGAKLTKEMVNRLIEVGVSFVAMDVGTDNIKWQLDPADPKARELADNNRY